jgi:hypothetical protein
LASPRRRILNALQWSSIGARATRHLRENAVATIRSKIRRHIRSGNIADLIERLPGGEPIEPYTFKSWREIEASVPDANVPEDDGLDF